MVGLKLGPTYENPDRPFLFYFAVVGGNEVAVEEVGDCCHAWYFFYINDLIITILGKPVEH